MVKASEYQKAFKDRPETAQIHQDGLDYRVERRRAEHHHSIDAFSWDTSSEDSEKADNNPHPVSVPAHKCKHEKYNKVYQEKLRESQELKLQTEAASVSKTTKSRKKRVDENDLHLEIPTPSDSGNVEEAKVNGSCPDHANGQHLDESLTAETAGTDKETQTVKRSRPKKPVTGIVQKKFIPKPRPVSAQVCRPLRQQARDDKPPFVSYGCMDNEKFTNTKKTYNVRASEDVYPSALRAMKRREFCIKKKEEDQKQAPFSERRKKALFNDFDAKMKRETTQWDTEYRNHFVGYDQTEYKRSLSARAPSRGAKANEAFFVCM